MTFREFINEVLIRLREDTISVDWEGDIRSSDGVTDYQRLVGSLVNDAISVLSNPPLNPIVFFIPGA